MHNAGPSVSDFLRLRLYRVRSFSGFLAPMVLIGFAVTASGAGAKPAETCSDLKRLAKPDVVIDVAEMVPAGTVAKESGLPEHCHVQGMLNPRTGADGKEFGIGFDLRMPTDWNGRFAFQGGGGLDGMLRPALGGVNDSINPPALARGYAVISTDGGHRSGSMLDASFAVDQQARLDYAFNAMDRVTRMGKDLVRRYYGSQPEYSYLLGCSNGGRQGLMASQRYPRHFDGIVAGDPAFKLTRIAMDQVWNIQVVASIAPKNDEGRPILSKAFSDSDLQLVADAVLKQCDALDGLEDGMINDWQACDFHPRQLKCTDEKTDQCLSSDQVKALHKLHQGPVDSDGNKLYGRFPYDTGIANPVWRRMRMGTATDGTWDAMDAVLGFETLRMYAMTPPDPDFDPMTFDFDTDPARTKEMAAIGDADETYLQTFADNGKMIVYHGLSDQGMATGALTDWYDEVIADNGEDIRDSVRLFLVPGMTHCGGGRATDDFDMLDAIRAWVEDDEAPDRIIATGDSFPGVSRPLCPYPKVARYEGGDPDDAASFVCRR